MTIKAVESFEFDNITYLYINEEYFKWMRKDNNVWNYS